MMQRGRPGAAAAGRAQDKREADGKAIEAEVRKYVDEAYPIVRDRALKLAPLDDRRRSSKRG